MSSNSNVISGTLWATRDTDTTRPTSWARSILGGLIIEAGLVGVLGAVAMAHEAPVQREVVMQVAMVQPEAPKPPAAVEEIVKQKPLVQKPVARKIVMVQPRQAAPPPVMEPTPQPAAEPAPPAPPTPAPLIAAAERPNQEAPAVAAPAPVHEPPKPVAMTLTCPVQTPPEMPAHALSAGIGGRVVARATIKAGKVIGVEILKSSPPGVFDAAVKRAMMQYQCDSNVPDVVVADQTFNFSLN